MILIRIFTRIVRCLEVYNSLFFLFVFNNKKIYLRNFQRGLFSVEVNNYVFGKFPEFIRKYDVLTHIDKFVIHEIEPDGFYAQKFPALRNIGLLSFVMNIRLKSRNIYLFENAELRPLSSFVYCDNLVYIPKQRHETNIIKAAISEYRISLDRKHLIELNETDYNSFFCQNAISLMGHYSDHFGHFLLEYIERMNHIIELGIDSKSLTILLNEGLDPNIKDLVLEEQLSLGFSINYIPKNSKVFCDKYYHIDPCTIVCDGAHYTSITDKLYYASVRNYFKQKQARSISGIGRKLYLVRRGRRTLLNFNEVEAYFAKSGYELIDNCHEMSILEKRSLFGNASFIVGPSGSAFFNCIWCPRDVKILNFVNYEIAYDNFLQNILSEEAEIYHLAGKEINYEFYNSDYHIELDEIIHYAKELGFTS